MPISKISKRKKGLLWKQQSSVVSIVLLQHTQHYTFQNHILAMNIISQTFIIVVGLIGSKNHSRMFPYKFLPHIYNVIRTSIKNFIITNKLPFGILADKMTSNHLTRHMVGIRIPIWIYAAHS